MGIARKCNGIVVVATVSAVWLSVSSPARATDVVTTPFLGITLHQRTETSPRPLKINVIEVNLSAPGISFRVTPSNGALPGETTLQTTRDYLTSQLAFGAKMAINANFFGTVSGSFADNVGLVSSDGDHYSPFTSGFDALNITSSNIASVVKWASPDPTGFVSNPPVSLYNAVSGNERIIAGGVNTASLTDLQPRTCAGVASGNRLILMTVDGRQPGVSEGIGTIDLANLMLGYGVTDAIDLDGGGSTTMAIANPVPTLVNVPSDGVERAVGVNFAIFASALPEPASATIGLMFISGTAMVRRRRAS